MPELPEVETMVRGVRPHLVGRVIREVSLCRNNCKPILIKPGISQIRKRMVGQTCVGVRRLGKRVIIEASGGWSLVLEPRMTGLVLLSDPPDDEHLRLRIRFDGDGTYESVWFWDRRGLGVVRLFSAGQMESELGPGVLGKDALEMSLEDWAECCGKSRREIKILLLDQKAVAGIGNLYASEILHLAAINPMAAANSLKSNQLVQLAKAVGDVLRKAVEYEGSTLGDGTYRNALNQHGRYQNEHRVYMREGEKCLACQKMPILRVVQGQRSTFYCPACQRLPRK